MISVIRIFHLFYGVGDKKMILIITGGGDDNIISVISILVI